MKLPATGAPPPPLDFNVSGWCSTRVIRIRQGMLWPILEELHEHKNGEKRWIKCHRDMILHPTTETEKD